MKTAPASGRRTMRRREAAGGGFIARLIGQDLASCCYVYERGATDERSVSMIAPSVGRISRCRSSKNSTVRMSVDKCSSFSANLNNLDVATSVQKSNLKVVVF
jgi:hypothetical protein